MQSLFDQIKSTLLLQLVILYSHDIVYCALIKKNLLEFTAAAVSDSWKRTLTVHSQALYIYCRTANFTFQFVYVLAGVQSCRRGVVGG